MERRESSIGGHWGKERQHEGLVLIQVHWYRIPGEVLWLLLLFLECLGSNGKK